MSGPPETPGTAHEMNDLFAGLSGGAATAQDKITDTPATAQLSQLRARTAAARGGATDLTGISRDLLAGFRRAVDTAAVPTISDLSGTEVVPAADLVKIIYAPQRNTAAGGLVCEAGPTIAEYNCMLNGLINLSCAGAEWIAPENVTIAATGTLAMYSAEFVGAEAVD